MPQAVIFDIDGTLVDSVDAHALAWEHAFRQFGREIPYQDVRAQIGKGGDQLLPVFLSKEEIQRFGADLEQVKGEIFRREYLPGVRPFPQVRDLFARLREDGIAIALASSASQQDLASYRKLLGVDDLLEADTSADDAERSKPEPDIFAAALAKLGHPNEALVVGDSPYDAEAARKLNLPVIGLLCGGFPEEDLRGAGCRAVYASPADLLAHYQQAFGTRKAA